MSAAQASATVRRLEAVAAMPDGDAPARGDKVLATVRALKNLSADLVADHVRHLLESGCWRSYRLPNGRSYQWRACEFDYFLAASDIDPRLVESAVREIGDRDLLLKLAEASDQRRGRRRAPAEVLARYPELAGRLAAHRIGGTAVHRLLGNDEAATRYRQGVGAEVARCQRQWWRVSWSGQDDIERAAGAIVGRLRREPGMAQAVRDLLEDAT